MINNISMISEKSIKINSTLFSWSFRQDSVHIYNKVEVLMLPGIKGSIKTNLISLAKLASVHIQLIILANFWKDKLYLQNLDVLDVYGRLTTRNVCSPQRTCFFILTLISKKNNKDRLVNWKSQGLYLFINKVIKNGFIILKSEKRYFAILKVSKIVGNILFFNYLINLKTRQKKISKWKNECKYSFENAWQ